MSGFLNATDFASSFSHVKKWVTNCMSQKWAKPLYSESFAFYVLFGQAQRSKGKVALTLCPVSIYSHYRKPPREGNIMCHVGEYVDRAPYIKK